MSKYINPLIAGYDDEDLPDEAVIPELVDFESGSDKLTQPADAMSKNYQIPPKLVEDVQNDPEKIRPVARSMAAVNLHNLFKRIQHPATTNSDRLAFQTMLNKMSGLESKEPVITPGSGFSIVINIPDVGATKGHTIEATAITQTEVTDADEVQD